MPEKKSFLEKYEIPIEHLDFEYIKTCKNVQELEKMLEILRSGEEGYYPDLVKFSESKLRDLDANNRMFLTESKCKWTGFNENKEIEVFSEQVRKKDLEIRNSTDDVVSKLPSIRTQTKCQEETSNKVKTKRINAFDYDRWNKFDADTECLKIDLEEEQKREQFFLQHKQKKNTKIVEILPEMKLNKVEKMELADKHRIKGNEYFKCADHSQALQEYTTSLLYYKTAATYNNRAITNLKMKRYDDAIYDCDECLKLDKKNVKAMIRRYDCLMATNRKNQAYQQCLQILEIDPENDIAKKALADISIRLEIQDVSNGDSNIQCPKEANDIDTDDFQRLIIPKKIVPSKVSIAMQNINRASNKMK